MVCVYDVESDIGCCVNDVVIVWCLCVCCVFVMLSEVVMFRRGAEASS